MLSKKWLLYNLSKSVSEGYIIGGWIADLSTTPGSFKPSPDNTHTTVLPFEVFLPHTFWVNVR